MSTRSIIGTANDGGFAGRYCHWDGYPTAKGEQLMETYRQLDGDLEAVERYAIRADVPGYWSSYMPPIAAALEDAKPDKVACELCADDPGFRTWPHGRTECNACRGTLLAHNFDKSATYVTNNGDSWAKQSESWGAEWAYLLDERGITVLEARWDGERTSWRRAGVVAWDDADPDWRGIESGRYAEAGAA